MTSKEALKCLEPSRWDDKEEIKAYEVLEKLVERDKPKKVEIGILKKFTFPICPNCKVELNEHYKYANKFCKECGQRLDWN